jgi:hypothetical protein
MTTMFSKISIINTILAVLILFCWVRMRDVHRCRPSRVLSGI